jgi:hypothetical protein
MTEAEVMKNINTALALKERTSIFIAHRYAITIIRSLVSKVSLQVKDSGGSG